MIDLHTHVLPGIDDGARDWEVALKMLEGFSACEMQTIVATPHFMDGYCSTPEEVRSLCNKLQQKAAAEGLEIEVLPGMEVYLSPGIPEMLRKNELLTINDTGKYMLVELPFQEVPAYTQRVIFELLIQNVTPVIAHPERNTEIEKDPNLMLRLLEKGALAQVNAGSLTGLFGDRVRRTAETLLTHNMIHCLASDAHSAVERGPGLGEALQRVKQLLGEQEAARLVWDNPLKVLQGQAIVPEEPLIYKKKLISRIFSW
ncbi:MAG: tyrosine-protein phosphatase [Bacillota bacterium]